MLKLCQTNQRLHNICQNDLLWERKTKLDFNQYIKYKNLDETWRQFYFRIISPHSVIVKIIPNGSYFFPTYLMLIGPQTNLNTLTLNLVNTTIHNQRFSERYFIVIFLTGDFKTIGYIIYDRPTKSYNEYLIDNNKWYVNTQLIVIVNRGNISKLDIDRIINIYQPSLSNPQLEKIITP